MNNLIALTSALIPVIILLLNHYINHSKDKRITYGHSYINDFSKDYKISKIKFESILSLCIYFIVFILLYIILPQLMLLTKTNGLLILVVGLTIVTIPSGIYYRSKASVFLHEGLNSNNFDKYVIYYYRAFLFVYTFVFGNIPPMIILISQVTENTDWTSLIITITMYVILLAVIFNFRSPQKTFLDAYIINYVVSVVINGEIKEFTFDNISKYKSKKIGYIRTENGFEALELNNEDIITVKSIIKYKNDFFQE